MNPADDRRGPSSAALVAVGVLLAIGAAGAFIVFGRGDAGPNVAAPGATGKPGASFVPATRMDPAKAALVSEPTGMRLDVVLAGTTAGETFYARRRDSLEDPRRPTIFLDRGTPRTDIGRLDVTSTAGAAAGETRLSIRIPAAVDAVTVIDLRASGRWEGFVVEATAPR